MSNIGLVLSGGMAKGAYQTGALQAINEVLNPTDFSVVSAASVGALNAYAYLTGGLDKGIGIWNDLNNNNNNRKYVMGLIKSGYMQEAVKRILTDKKIQNTFYIPLLNLKKRALSYVNLGKIQPSKVEPYLGASVALPFFNPGVQINKGQFYDGALIDNIPIHPILKHQIDYIICIYFDNYDYIFESKYFDNKVIKINFTDNSIISNSLSLDESSIKYMINEGYTKAKSILDFCFVDGINATSTIYSKIEELNARNTDKNLRITGDIVVNNMNKVVRKFMKRITVH